MVTARPMRAMKTRSDKTSAGKVNTAKEGDEKESGVKTKDSSLLLPVPSATASLVKKGAGLSVENITLGGASSSTALSPVGVGSEVGQVASASSQDATRFVPVGRGVSLVLPDEATIDRVLGKYPDMPRHFGLLTTKPVSKTALWTLVQNQCTNVYALAQCELRHFTFVAGEDLEIRKLHLACAELSRQKLLDTIEHRAALAETAAAHGPGFFGRLDWGRVQKYVKDLQGISPVSQNFELKSFIKAAGPGEKVLCFG
jgi:hypothetical protein